MEAKWTPGQVAIRCGVKVSTLHFYEEKGLIRSWRNQGNQRRYTADVLRRVSVIKAAQQLGVSLAEIKQAFDSLPKSRTPTKADWQVLSESWRESLELRIKKLQNLQQRLDGCIGCGCLSLESCPLYNPNDELNAQGSGPIILDRCG